MCLGPCDGLRAPWLRFRERIEVRVDLVAAQTELWIDGRNEGRIALPIPGPSDRFQVFRIGTIAGATRRSISSTAWIDDIVIAESPIGCR